MPSRIAASFSITTSRAPPDRAAAAAPRRTGQTSGCERPAGRQSENREPRPGTDRTLKRMLQHACDPLDDREPQAEAAVALLGVAAEPPELLEDLDLLLLRDPDAGIDHVDAKVRTLAPHPDQHAAAPRVADRVRDEVHERPRKHVPIGHGPPPRSARAAAPGPCARPAARTPSPAGAAAGQAARCSIIGVTTPASSFEMSSRAREQPVDQFERQLDVLDQALGTLPAARSRPGRTGTGGRR